MATQTLRASFLWHLCLPRLARGIFVGALAFVLVAAASTTPQRTNGGSFSQDELDALLAPIALYPDDLLSQVLMASTYPLEIVEVDRFVQRNPALRGDPLDEALARKRWDPSVQSLAAYPSVLAMMSERLEWTEQLGNAVLADEARVMDTVQSLRRRAEETGNLKSTQGQTVIRARETIVIEPAQTSVVYVYQYDPAFVYGAAWYAAAYHYYERWYGGYSYSGSVSYRSYQISNNHWNWARADWQGRRLSVDGRGNRFWSNAGRAQGAGAWQHDALHRRSVGYPDPATRDQFGARPHEGPNSDGFAGRLPNHPRGPLDAPGGGPPRGGDTPAAAPPQMPGGAPRMPSGPMMPGPPPLPGPPPFPGPR